MAKLEMFLSHVHVESRFADFIQATVKRDFLGLVNVFVASDGGILAGHKWLDEMTRALRASDVHVVLCSPEAMTRQWVSFETGAAHLRGIPIIPLCYGGLKPAQLPVPLSEFQSISLSRAEENAQGESGFHSLYRGLATLLGSDVPDADFEEYRRQFVALEDRQEREHRRLEEGSLDDTGVEIIHDPRVLCVSSEQFMRTGFENQLELVLKAFPSSIRHERVFSSDLLRRTLGRERIDIVHIAAYVCPRSGDLYFSDVDLATGRPLSQPLDKISADAFAQLLELSEVKLAVITGADSMALTATLLAACHVVAARDMVAANQMAAWVEAFYAMLPQHPLSRALEFALNQSKAPMRLYARQPNSVDLVVRTAAG